MPRYTLTRSATTVMAWVRASISEALEEQMYSLARDLEFEKAAQMRDEIAKLKEAHFGVSTKAA